MNIDGLQDRRRRLARTAIDRAASSVASVSAERQPVAIERDLLAAREAARRARHVDRSAARRSRDRDGGHQVEAWQAARIAIAAISGTSLGDHENRKRRVVASVAVTSGNQNTFEISTAPVRRSRRQPVRHLGMSPFRPASRRRRSRCITTEPRTPRPTAMRARCPPCRGDVRGRARQQGRAREHESRTPLRSAGRRHHQGRHR